MSAAAPVILLVHAAATLFMTGLIWFVQIVHYPLFTRIGADAFHAYERDHVARTGLIVGPTMLLEAISAAALLALLALRPAPGAAWLLWTGAALLAVIWLSTALLQVPCHRRLERDGFDAFCARRLVRTNWIRTAAWSARSVIALALLRQAMPA